MDMQYLTAQEAVLIHDLRLLPPDIQSLVRQMVRDQICFNEPAEVGNVVPMSGRRLIRVPM